MITTFTTAIRFRMQKAIPQERTGALLPIRNDTILRGARRDTLPGRREGLQGGGRRDGQRTEQRTTTLSETTSGVSRVQKRFPRLTISFPSTPFLNVEPLSHRLLHSLLLELGCDGFCFGLHVCLLVCPLPFMAPVHGFRCGGNLLSFSSSRPSWRWGLSWGFRGLLRGCHRRIA